MQNYGQKIVLVGLSGNSRKNYAKGSGKMETSHVLRKIGEGVCWTPSDTYVESQKEDQEPRPP